METRRERIEIAVCKALIVLTLVAGAWFLTVGAALLAGSPS